MSTTTAPRVTEGATVLVGHHSMRNRPHGTVLTIDGDGFIRIGSTVYAMCNRCGSDVGTRPEFGHRFAGQCFGCAGRGVGRCLGTVEEAAKIARRRAKARERAAAKREEKRLAAVAERDALAAAWREANADLATVLFAFDEDETKADDADTRLLVSIAIDAKLSGLTEAQADLARRLLDEHKAKEVARAAQRFTGEVGDKITVTGTVVTAMSLETRFGFSRLVVIEGTGDDAGVTVKTFGTGETLWSAERDQQVTITGTVKGHDTYQGTQQTVLTRTKITEETA